MVNLFSILKSRWLLASFGLGAIIFMVFICGSMPLSADGTSPEERYVEMSNQYSGLQSIVIDYVWNSEEWSKNQYGNPSFPLLTNKKYLGVEKWTYWGGSWSQVVTVWDLINGTVNTWTSGSPVPPPPYYAAGPNYTERKLFRITDNYNWYQSVLNGNTTTLISFSIPPWVPPVGPDEEIVSAQIKGTDITTTSIENNTVFFTSSETIDPETIPWVQSGWDSRNYASTRESDMRHRVNNPVLVLTIRKKQSTDTAPPTTTAVANPTPVDGWNKDDVTVTLTAVDEGENASGVKEIHWDGQFVAGSTATIPVAGEGERTIQFYAIDNADNAEEPKQTTVRIDKTPPTVAEPVFGFDGTYSKVIVSAAVTDNLSGIRYAKIVATSHPSASEIYIFNKPYPPSKDISLSIDIGALTPGYEFSFFIEAADAVGNGVYLPYTRRLTIAKDENGKPTDVRVQVGDDINVTSGNMFIVISDLFIPARGMPLSFGRTYNSRDNYNGPLGYGWIHSYNTYLTEYPDGTVIETDEDGTEIIFIRNQDETYQPEKGEYSKLEKSETGFALTRKHGTKYNFDLSGKLIQIEDRNGNIQSFTYTGNNLTQIADATGRVVSITYNVGNRINTITDPAQRIIAYQYDETGNLISVTDPAGNITQYTYDEKHNLTAITDAHGNHTYFAYDENDRCVENRNDADNNKITLFYDRENMSTTVTDALGNSIVYTYNVYGVCTSLTNASGYTKIFTWDDNINRTASTDANGNTTRYEYDARGNIITIIDPSCNTTRFTYEPNYDLVSTVTDALNHQTQYLYNQKGNLIQVTDALGNSTGYEYDQTGKLIALTDANGNKTLYGYDAYGNLTLITDPLSNQTRFIYDILGNSTQMTDAKGIITSYTYDNLNRLTVITYTNGTNVRYTYDAIGNRLSVTDQNNNTTYYAYDVVNRLVSVTDALGNITQYEYDRAGNRTAIIDANERRTQYLYDELNRLKEVTTPLGHKTLYTYDPVGNRTSTTDANGNTIQYFYDSLNWLTGTQANGQTVSFTYDAAGRRTAMTDWQGTTVYTYDELNRLVSVDGPEDRDTISYTYNKVGSRISMINQDGGITYYQYDVLNRLTTLTDPTGKVTRYEYNEVSNLTKMDYPNNTQANYAYDQLNRLIELVNESSRFRHSERSEESNRRAISSYAYKYNSAGMKTKITLKDGTYIEYEYDALNRLTKEAKYKEDKWGHRKHLVYSYEYTFDAVGNRLTMRRNLHQPMFWGSMNDDLMDDIKNGLCRNGFGPSESDRKDGEDDDNEREDCCKETTNHRPSILTTYTYNEENQLLVEEEGIEWKNRFISLKKTEYTYDNNGNQIKKTLSKGYGKSQKEWITTYVYDYENRLTKIIYPTKDCKRGKPEISEYVYDGTGKRIKSIENDDVTKYLYDGLNVIIERDGSDNTVAFYNRGLSYGGGIGGIISRTTQDAGRTTHDSQRQTQYYHYDGLGSVTNLTSEKGHKTTSYQYDAYGNILKQTGSASDNSYQFSTKEFSAKSELTYFGARYYDSKIGRWLTKDPYIGDIFRPSSMQKYLYTENNPINYIDPWGLTIIIEGDGELAAAIEQLKQSPRGMELYNRMNSPSESPFRIRVGQTISGEEGGGAEYNPIGGDITLDIDYLRGRNFPVVAALAHELAEREFYLKLWDPIYLSRTDAKEKGHEYALKTENIIRGQLNKPPRQ